MHALFICCSVSNATKINNVDEEEGVTNDKTAGLEIIAADSLTEEDEKGEEDQSIYLSLDNIRNCLKQRSSNIIGTATENGDDKYKQNYNTVDCVYLLYEFTPLIRIYNTLNWRCDDTTTSFQAFC